MTNPTFGKTVVFDAGARYGMHPSWNRFFGDLQYFAFEPDAKEAQRLREQNDPKSFIVHEVALDKTEGERTFNVQKHRGLSSFLEPNPDSECFRTPDS